MKKILLLTFISFFISNCASTKNNESVGEYIDSATITAKVKADLASDKDVKSIGINVDTYKDVVQLSGFVDNNMQKEKAEQLTKNVKGVKKVINSLNIKTQL